MRVICTRTPGVVDSVDAAESPWVKAGGQYVVLGVLAQPGRRVLLHLLLSDGQGLAWFDADFFETVDATTPANWLTEVSEGEVVQLGPKDWLPKGFWERYYDGEPAAVAAVEREIAVAVSSPGLG